MPKKPKRKKPKTILVVDDEPDVSELICDLLRGQDYEFVMAMDGREALKKILEIKPDLVILDLILPQLNGWEVAQRLKLDERYREFKDTPVIILSGVIREAGPPESYEYGDFYLTKPIDRQQLLTKVRELLHEAE